jgi:phosphoenolpyruvate carboxylase
MFLTLPLDAVEQVGLLLPLFEEECRIGFENKDNPTTIVEKFFTEHKPMFTESEQISFLFKIIHYIERQIVLIDALEDAAYGKINDIDGPNSLHQIIERSKLEHLDVKLGELLETFSIKTVLTAHPTQFYPGQILAIISDLTDAISHNHNDLVRDLLEQLGRTPFFKKKKPSPLDEAVSLTWYLRYIFYPAIGEIADRLSEQYPDQVKENSELISLGFWPGGDRDGNPFVDVDITLKVARKLRYTIISCYYSDIRSLKRRLSFEGVYEKLEHLEKLLYLELTSADTKNMTSLDFLEQELSEIETLLIDNHNGFFLQKILSFKTKVRLFGLHMASLDIRQDSRVIQNVFQAVSNANPNIFPSDIKELSEDEQIEYLLNVKGNLEAEDFEEALVIDTLASFRTIKQIQSENTEKGAHRYIISNCRGPLDMARVIALFRLFGWADIPLSVDIVPLFETIADLHNADASMQNLYNNSSYKKHLDNRSNRQSIMLGFSDGTKDGGYLMANWAIYTAKERITSVSRNSGVKVIFFDGRGGPPARGGGSAHLFYASLGKNIENIQTEITIQGQTISTHYGTMEAAIYNLEQLLGAGLENNLHNRKENNLNEEQRALIDVLASHSYKKYEAFKQHPLFMPYLEERSTLKYYSMANIGSRPSKRTSEQKFRFEDLRAIPFVGAWSQLKQNVPGFFGLGSALKEQELKGNLQACISLYKESNFFRALISNSMQSMSKTNFDLTNYMKEDKKFGQFWEIIYSEFELSKEMVLKISSQQTLLEDNPRSRLSIELREKVVLPLLTIQQYALMRVQMLNSADAGTHQELYEKMVMRTLFGSINASRNSV